jgi:hypothetical protein
MIERLRDRAEYRNRDESEAARLLKSVGPAVAPPAVEQRVLDSLGGPRRLGPRAMRIATVASVPMVATAVLAATLAVMYGRGARPRHSKAPTTQPSVSSRPAVASPLPLAVDYAPAAAQAVLPAEDRTASRPAPSAPPPKLSPGNRRQQAVSSRSRVTPMADSTSPIGVPGSPAPNTDSDPDPESADARTAAAPAEEASLVLGALRALRRSHDPVRAGVLTARYLGSFPQGALVQEATAIAIQASLARGDRESAARLAKEYLDRYPDGRFVPLARKAATGARP